MRWLTKISLRLRSLFHRAHVDGELHSELRFHLEQQIAVNIAAGMPPAEAQREAMRNFGGVESLKEECRDMRKVNWIQDLGQDLRFGMRMLRKSPSFTIVAIFTLALGIGANTAIFSMVDWLALRPLPVQKPAQLAFLGFSLPSNSGNGERFDANFSNVELQDIRNQTGKIFSDVAGYCFGGVAGDTTSADGLTVNGITKPVQNVYVTGNFFTMMGIRPLLGRLILPSEGRVAGANPVVVISYRYWMSRFNGDTAIVGKNASLNGHPVTIVGIAAKGFVGITPILETQIYLPLGMAAVNQAHVRDFMGDPKVRRLLILGRERPGVSLEEAQAVLTVVGRRLLKQYPREEHESALHAYALRPPGIMNGENPIPKAAFVFLTLAGFVLILACINVANLLLVRATVRQREMAVRSALGAGRGRLVRQLLTESLLLALFGCVAGIIAGIAGSRALTAIPIQTELPLLLDFQPDWRVFAYAFTAALLTGIFVGIAPAIRASRGNLNAILHEGDRASTGKRQRVRGALVAMQVAGSLMLLIVAGLFVRSLQGVTHADLGFVPQHVLNLTVDPHEIGYSAKQGMSFYRGLLERVRVLPGIQSASLAAIVPLGDTIIGDGLRIPGRQLKKGEAQPNADMNEVSPDYFNTMRIRILRGRDFTSADSETAPHLAVINEAMAKKFWADENPVGRQFIRASDPRNQITIIGLVKNSRMVDLYSPFDECFFVPIAQSYSSSATLQVRTIGAPESVARPIAQLIDSIAPAMPVVGIRTMTKALSGLNGLFLFQIGAGLASVLGLLGLTLAVVGIFGVMSYTASQRTHEIGIRMALGAQPEQILFMICRQGFYIAAAGLALGICAAFGIGQLLGDFLIGVKPTDSLTYAGVSVLLTAAVLLSCYIPARRAMRVDPMVALRYE